MDPRKKWWDEVRGRHCFNLSLFLYIQIILIGSKLNFPQAKYVLLMTNW